MMIMLRCVIFFFQITNDDPILSDTQLMQQMQQQHAAAQQQQQTQQQLQQQAQQQAQQQLVVSQPSSNMPGSPMPQLEHIHTHQPIQTSIVGTNPVMSLQSSISNPLVNVSAAPISSIAMQLNPMAQVDNHE